MSAFSSHVTSNMAAYGGLWTKSSGFTRPHTSPTVLGLVVVIVQGLIGPARTCAVQCSRDHADVLCGMPSAVEVDDTVWMEDDVHCAVMYDMTLIVPASQITGGQEGHRISNPVPRTTTCHNYPRTKPGERACPLLACWLKAPCTAPDQQPAGIIPSRAVAAAPPPPPHVISTWRTEVADGGGLRSTRDGPDQAENNGIEVHRLERGLKMR
ncbi:hypothetical protein QBC40DRAFT_296502 [Triangularia verruculosa]|uniref:Uncharacterized protein n=1 Tax=Triangularia verruculosa TaxID=2587418 RepID=A0AAN6XL65_9PEZI|nr:hypothetical protein QBC40DRAFT_296502 [Triangularia verruculosa]